MRPDHLLFKRGVPATPDGVRTALGRLSDAMAPLALTLDEVGTVQLVLAEALNNIVEHAYAGIEGDQVTIVVRECGDALHFRLCDSGAPMPDGRAPQGDCPEPAAGIDDQPESGFGWFLIRTLARDLDYRRVAGRNELTFAIPLRLAPPRTGQGRDACPQNALMRPQRGPIAEG